MSRAMRRALDAVAGIEGGLKLHFFNLDSRRTSVRLDALTWDALCDIAKREDMTVHDICRQVAACERRGGLSFTVALRCVITGYFRAAAGEDPRLN